MVLIMTFGRTTLDEHCRFIPVYFMASSFMTASWPSLFRSLGLPQKTLGTLEDHLDPPAKPKTCAPMAEVARIRGRVEPVDPYPDPLEAQGGQMDALPPRSSPSPLPGGMSPGEWWLSEGPAAASQRLELLHMGPSSDCSAGSAHTGSISLDSRASLPSEMSDDVRLLFQAEMDGRGPWAAPPRTTSRRLDIEALGQTYDFRREADLRPPLQPRVRKSLSL